MFESGRASQILHRPSGDFALIDDTYNIDYTFAIASNWNECTATFKKGAHRYKCLDFSSMSSGPRKDGMLVGKLAATRLEEIVGKVKEQIEAEDKAATDASLESQRNDYLEPAKHARAETTKRARGPWQQKQQARQLRRESFASKAKVEPVPPCAPISAA